MSNFSFSIGKDFKLPVSILPFPSLRGMFFSLYNNQNLISDATGANLKVKSEFCAMLLRNHGRGFKDIYQEFAEYSEKDPEVYGEYLEGIGFDGNALIFSCFLGVDVGMQESARILLDYIIQHELTKKQGDWKWAQHMFKTMHVKMPVPSEKREALQNWLNLIEWSATDYENERRLLLDGIEGKRLASTSYSYSSPSQFFPSSSLSSPSGAEGEQVVEHSHLDSHVEGRNGRNEKNGRNEREGTEGGEAERVSKTQFSFPIEQFDLHTLQGLFYDFFSYSELITKASGVSKQDLIIDKTVCEKLSEALSMEEALNILKEAMTSNRLAGIEVTGNYLSFTAFETVSQDIQRALVLFLNLLLAFERANPQRKLNFKKLSIKTPDNEKFAFRIWLIRLGWKGITGKKERILLYKNLKWNTVFCTPESKEVWIANRREEKNS